MPPSRQPSPWSAGPRQTFGPGRAGVGQSDLADPFAEDPVRRSAALVAFSALVVFGPVLIGGPVATTVMLSVGWLGLTGLVMGLPILVWSLAEEGWDIAQRRLHPPIEVLTISPRVAHILLRHGYRAIRDVEIVPDDELLGLSNMDTRGLREVRRAISLWKYQRWQERGFPATGYD